ncbi:hypothetical protein [Methanomethylophilus alvi]|uniref:hypothetical protein n=1 Tax=Methanomethylophilus alvi TaxID=1291540 RepID=UPI0037DD4B0A
MSFIHNQPNDGAFGELLNDTISKSSYSNVILVSAFARKTGVLSIKQALTQFRDNGGNIDAYIGIDLGGTSYEALVELLQLVDNLYICHDNRISVTFHPKIYLLENKKNAWVAIGSNNLTHGGLYGNIECSSIFELNLDLNEDLETFNSLKKNIEEYHKQTDFCLKADLTLLDKLLDDKEIFKELEIVKNNSKKGVPHVKKYKIFGIFKRSKKQISPKNPGKNPRPHDPIDLKNASGFWFETGKMTGGSRNILDLSKTGMVVKGDVSVTQYAVEDKSNVMMGGVSFFGIDPNETSLTKDIVINYNGKDYSGNTIKIETEGAKPNLSWRMQLKGVTTDGEKITSVANFVNKILLFQEISPGYYSMSVLEMSTINVLLDASELVATNGMSSKSRKYGVLAETNLE